MKNCRQYIKQLKSQRNKLQLTNTQIKLLNDVFNFAIHYLESTKDTQVLFRFDDKGMATSFDVDKFINDTVELGQYINSRLEVKDENAKKS